MTETQSIGLFFSLSIIAWLLASIRDELRNLRGVMQPDNDPRRSPEVTNGDRQ